MEVFVSGYCKKKNNPDTIVFRKGKEEIRIKGDVKCFLIRSDRFAARLSDAEVDSWIDINQLFPKNDLKFDRLEEKGKEVPGTKICSIVIKGDCFTQEIYAA